MSHAIDQAQAIRSILSDPSLPVGERQNSALQALREIDFALFDVSTIERLEDDCKQMCAVLDVSTPQLEVETSLNGLQADLAKTVAAMDESTRASRSEAPLDNQQAGPSEVRSDTVALRDSRLLELLDSAAARIVEAEIDRIVAELDVGFNVLPEHAIHETREHRELMIPRLIEVLQEAIATVHAGDLPEGQAHFFAVFLLTEFQANEAFPVMLEAFSLPDSLPSDLFGDAIHEVPMRMLAVFRGDQPDSIEALIDDRTLNMYIRWQAASSYLYLVREGHIDRDGAVRRLQRSLRRAIDGNDTDMAGPLVCELLDYAPLEAMADIREAFERDLVDEILVDMRTVELFIADGPSRLENAINRRGPAAMDTLAELKTWAAFQPKPPARPADKLSPLEASLPAPHFEAGHKPHAAKREPIVASGPRIGRNDPCPCGSGKKFKKCCGARV